MADILWVDDEVRSIDLYATELQKAGHHVTVVGSVDDAVKSLRSKVFDIMILDNMMPPGDLFTELDTMHGLRTGIYFAQYTRLHFPELAIVVISIAPPAEHDLRFLFANGIRFEFKTTLLDRSILEFVAEISEFEPKPRVTDMVGLKLAMFGLELDVRKFLEYMKWRLRQGKK